MTPPIGRAKNPAADVENVNSVAAVGETLGKYSSSMTKAAAVP